MNGSSEVNVLIIGLGSIGLRHARNFKSLGINALSGFDPSLERRKSFQDELGFTTFSCLDKALAEKPNLTVISSPNCFHLEQAITAALQGSHLFIEKPLSHNLDNIEQFLSVVESKKLFVHIGSNWKFHPAFKKMKSLIGEGVLGKITGAQVISGWWLPDWHPWEDYREMYSAKKSLGGGIVLDSHEFDYITWLLGPVEQVSGYMTTSGCLDIETEDVAVACLKHESGALSTIHVDYIQREYRRKYHISGDLGTLEWDYTTGVLSSYDAASKETIDYDVSHEDINDMYLEQTSHILKGISGKEQAMTSAHSAANVLEILCTIKGENVYG